MSANGKSIGEERATLLTISKETEPEQKFFPFANILKKVKGKIFCGYCYMSSQRQYSPRFLPIHC